MKALYEFLERPGRRIFFFVCFGLLTFTAILYVTELLHSIFLFSFIISVLAGFLCARLSFSQCLLMVPCFFIGWILGPPVIALVGAAFKGRLVWALGQISSLTMFGRVAIYIGPVFILPWVLGVPLGFFVGRKISKQI